MPADRCVQARQWLSAFQDGAALFDPGARDHINGCSACARWESTVTVLTRRLRVRSAAGADVTTPAMQRWRAQPASAVRGQGMVARIILAVAGAGGVGLGIAALTGAAGAAESHFVRDLIALESALAIGFLLGAWRPRRYVYSLLPVAGVAALLTVTSAASGLPATTADVVAEASHLPMLMGVLGLFVLVDAMGLTAPRRRRRG